MQNDHTVDDLLEFLQHAGKRGLMPAATAGALAVASRNVFGVLDASERNDVRQLDIEKVIKRFNNKRASDFSPSSLKEYARRVKTALNHYARWKQDPSNFTTKTRVTSSSVYTKNAPNVERADDLVTTVHDAYIPSYSTGYQTSFPIRAGRVVTLVNLPHDMTAAEADRLSRFIRMLVTE